MSEPGLPIFPRDRSEGDAQGFQQFVDCARFEFSQDRFHFRPTLFNRIQVRRIGWQEFQARPACGNQSLNAFALMHIQIINDHDIAFAQRWGKHVFDIGLKGVTRHPAFQHRGGTYFPQAQRGDQGVMLARIAGRRFPDAFARRRSSIQPRQPQMRPAFIDEFQMGGDGAQGCLNVLLKGVPQFSYARGVALTVVQ